jgi:hypothetical protein
MPKKKKPQNKTAFVLSLSPTMPAKEVLAKARVAGLKLSEKYVYVIRSKAKAGGKRNGRGRGSGRPPKAAAHAGTMDSHFASLLLDLGLERAEAILRNVRSKARAAARA